MSMNQWLRKYIKTHTEREKTYVSVNQWIKETHINTHTHPHTHTHPSGRSAWTLVTIGVVLSWPAFHNLLLQATHDLRRSQ